MKGHGWEHRYFKDETHIVPIDDDREHDPVNCWCNPVVDEDTPSVVVHNSFDKREEYENGRQKH